MAALPAKLDLGQVRKRAKDLARAESVELSEAQFRIAREHGFPSWPKLQAYVRRSLEGAQHAYHADIDYYSERALGLLASADDGTPSARAAFDRHRQPLTRGGARTVVAREHGFTSWRGLREHVKTLTGSGEPFARAYRLVEARDVDGPAGLVDEFPELAHAVGTNGNDLLGMAGATCDERLSRVLLARGADPARGNAHGWTPLHQAAYSNLPLLTDLLLDAGAPLDVAARGDGGTPLVVALFWGNRTVAEKLARHGKAPRNLRVAAGLGDAELLDELVRPNGTLAPAAGAHREFYRPTAVSRSGARPATRPHPRRGAQLGRAQRPHRSPAHARGARREPRRRRLPRHRAQLGRGAGQGHGRADAAGAGRGRQPCRHVRRAEARRRHHGTAPGRPEQPPRRARGAHRRAGADRDARDGQWHSTPEGWAEACDSPAARELLARAR